MFNFLTSLLSPVAAVADKMIMDKDKYAELQFKKAELEHEARQTLLTITTSPNIDAFVKLLYAFKEALLPLLRPVGTFLMLLFGAYCETNSITLSPLIEGVLFGAFPGWAASRHINKQTEEKEKTVRASWTDEY